MRVPQEVDEAVQLEDRDVVVEVAGGVLRVDLDRQHVQLQVGVELRVVVHVPLTQSNPQLLRSINIINHVRRRDKQTENIRMK